MNKINVMMVEDHKLMRVGLKSLFVDYPQINIIAEAENGKEALEKAKLYKPHVILMDIGLPDMDGITAMSKILDILPSTKVIMLTSHCENNEVLNSIKAGANAYAMKDINTEYLIMVIRTVNKGAMWIDPNVVHFLRSKNNGIFPTKQLSRADFKEQHSNLTEREYEVLKLLVDGCSNNDIATKLNISEHTAKAHVCNIIQKLVVDDRTQAAVKAIKEGIV